MFEPDIPNSFGEIIFEKLEALKIMHGLMNVFATKQFEFAVFDGCYLICYCLQRAENCKNCSN